jgi:crotonobetainyl-CoA:carnitine CoA-transferase CaiB-like acyl-CoA transferase
MGADVIKVEEPGGDVARYLGGAGSPGMGSIFLNANHGKRSVALDLKHPGGTSAMRLLLKTADVFVTNMRPAAVARLGLSYADVASLNARLIYAALPGFGSTGPYQNHAAYDDVIQAMSGVAATQGGAGEPAYVRTPIADKVAALMSLSGILAAVVRRAETGRGQAVEIPMFETMAEFMLLEQQGDYVFDPPRGPVGYARTSSPNRRPYRTSDGFIGVMVYTDKQWRSFFDLIGRSALSTDPRFETITARTANIDELYQLVADCLPQRTTVEWLRELRGLGIACMPVLQPADLFEDEHLRAVEFFERVHHPSEGPLMLARLPISFSADAPGALHAAPRLGEHGPEVLEELGMSREEVLRLVECGALVLSPRPEGQPQGDELSV